MRYLNRLLIVLCLSLVCTSYSSTVAGEYWQQEVNYVIDVTLDTNLRTIDGYIEIQYINNSPDSLDRIYLKAFPNAIQKGSYADKKQRSRNDYSFAALKPDEEGLLQLRDRSGVNHTYRGFEVDNTIITVYLIKTLYSGDTLDLSFDFTTVLPKPDRMRMGLRGGTSKAAYWYPQVCVYDRKMGWVNSQYLGWGECYGDFGRFDVTIRAPEDQIVAATGILVNKDEALPDSLRQMLDISNYIKPRNQWPKIELSAERSKSWHYIAERVNDFAWTSSNQFCIDSGSQNGVAVVAYPLRSKAKLWEKAVLYGKQSIETFSALYYPYQWPVIRIVDAFSGMEYPMLTNCGGGRAQNFLALLLYHEIGHQWFMGQVGSNQVDRPFLDEGFTTHLEHVAMEKYLGREGNYDNFGNWYQEKFAPSSEDREARGFMPLLSLMREDFDRQMIYTSYDQGKEYWPNRVSAYYKSAAMHYSLRSILGNSAYFDAMHGYCAKWFFRHPYEEDFVEAMEEATGIQFDQYFQQWFYSRSRLDYAFDGKKSRKTKSSIEHKIKLKRKGDFITPIDVAVLWEQGDTTFYTVAPEGMQYTKHGYILLPTWNQFRRREDKYQFTIKAARKIRKVVVDPFNLLMDIDRRNNSSSFFWPTEVRFDNLFYDRPLANKYKLRLRPDLWYNDPNGTEIGFHAHGAYHEEIAKFSLDFRVGTEGTRPLIDFTISNPFEPFGSHSKVWQRLLRSDRRTFYQTGFEKKFRKWQTRPDHELFRVEAGYLKLGGNESRSDSLSDDQRRYLPDAAWDAVPVYTTTVIAEMLRTFRYGSLNLKNREVIGFADGNESNQGFLEHRFQLELSLTRRNRQWLSTRLEAWQLNGSPPSQFIPELSRVRASDRFVQSSLFRNPGTFPAGWEESFYLDGGNVRGYQDRSVYVTSFIGGSIELTPVRLFKLFTFGSSSIRRFLAATEFNLFFDFGAAKLDLDTTLYGSPIADSYLFGKESQFYSSAGISLQFPSIWRGQSFRVDFPLYLNKPVEGDDEFKFRASVAWQLPSPF